MVLNSLLVQHVVGSLAAAGCFAVILTFLTFKELRSLRYIELVFYVSLNDMIASVGLALGGSKTGSFVCTFQAIVTNMNYLSAIFWTTIIAYQLWLAVHYNHTIQQGKMFLIHLICWGIPLVVTLLPLITNEYGNADDESTWCFIANRAHSPSWGLLFWDIFSFYVWIWLAVLFDLFFISSAWRTIRTLPTSTSMQTQAVNNIRMKVKRLAAYPIIIVFCWTFCSFADIYYLLHPGESLDVEASATLFSGLQGLLMSLTFFLVNPMVVYKWRALFTRQTLFLNRENNRFTLGAGSTIGGASLYQVEDEPDFIDPRDSFFSVDEKTANNTSGNMNKNSIGGGGVRGSAQREDDRNRIQNSVDGQVQFSTFATLDVATDAKILQASGGAAAGGGTGGAKRNTLGGGVGGINNPIIRDSDVSHVF